MEFDAHNVGLYGTPSINSHRPGASVKRPRAAIAAVLPASSGQCAEDRIIRDTVEERLASLTGTAHTASLNGSGHHAPSGLPGPAPGVGAIASADMMKLDHMNDEMQIDMEDAELDDERVKRSRKLLGHAHPYGIQPLGNLLVAAQAGTADSASPQRVLDCRPTGLGPWLRLIDDEILLEILQCLDGPDLGRLLRVSRALYGFCHESSLWRTLCLDAMQGALDYQHSWKDTYVMQRWRQQCALNDRQGVPQPEQPSRHQALQVRNLFSDMLFQPFLCASLDLQYVGQIENIHRRSRLSLEEFVTEYESMNRPVIITDVVTEWPAFKQQLWSKANLERQYGDLVFKTGRWQMPMRSYLQYCSQTMEESPIYLFDNEYGETAPAMLQQYEVPKYFSTDYFSLLEDNPRPSFRWILIGPYKSGSSFHKDPNSTNAWNGLISGRKKWIMYPPHVVPPGIFPSPDHMDVIAPFSVSEWFLNHYKPYEAQRMGGVECVLQPGELLFIPNSWWHLAINLEESIAVTQNYVGKQNVLNVLNFLGKTGKPNMKQELERRIQAKMPQDWQEILQKRAEFEQRLLRKRSLWERMTEDTPGGSAPASTSANADGAGESVAASAPAVDAGSDDEMDDAQPNQGSLASSGLNSAASPAAFAFSFVIPSSNA